ncbi:hypothetical protein [Streptomyces sp. 11-1-2]|uniref:hypothetical protein n=1 Tax=unclassified Streptomyces TaxID=2593676 RepID=UPI001F0918CC|nr:hypothetical protein [Streptomyces sp. 11-1-2]
MLVAYRGRAGGRRAGTAPSAGLHAQDVTVEFAPEAVDWIARRGHEPAYGARPLRRTIQREVDNRLSRPLLDADTSSGDRARVEVADGHLVFHTTGTASNAKQP